MTNMNTKDDEAECVEDDEGCECIDVKILHTLSIYKKMDMTFVPTLCEKVTKSFVELN